MSVTSSSSNGLKVPASGLSSVRCYEWSACVFFQAVLCILVLCIFVLSSASVVIDLHLLWLAANGGATRWSRQVVNGNRKAISAVL